MAEPELPELPKPDGTAEVATGHMPVGTMKADITETIDAWSEPLVRAYGMQCYEAGVKAERERCAKLCEALRDRWVDGSDQFGRSCPAKVRVTPSDCAVAIRKG